MIKEIKKTEILEELKERFDEIKKDLGFKASFEELEKYFAVQDGILQDGFVGVNFSRQLCFRIADRFGSWNNYLHSLLLPNTGVMTNMAEASLFNDIEKQAISKLISQTMAIISKNSFVNITKDRKLEAEFIDSALEFYKTTFQPQVEEIMKKVKDHWIEQSKKDYAVKKRDLSGFG